MIGGINFASSQIADVYNNGASQLANTLTKIASGKKFQNAAEDLTGFLRSQNLKVDIDGYEQVKQDLTSFKSYTAAAVQASSSIYEALTEMKELAQKYSTGSADQQAEYTAEWNSLKTQVTKTIEATVVDGDVVTAEGSIKIVDLDPDGTKQLDMDFSAIADVSLLDVDDDITAALGLNDQIDNMLTYMSEAKSFDAIANQQLNLTNTIINSKNAVMSLITDIDEADEMNNALDQSIRQQAAMSMLSQANMSRQAVMKLYM